MDTKSRIRVEGFDEKVFFDGELLYTRSQGKPALVSSSNHTPLQKLMGVLIWNTRETPQNMLVSSYNIIVGDNNIGGISANNPYSITSTLFSILKQKLAKSANEFSPILIAFPWYRTVYDSAVKGVIFEALKTYNKSVQDNQKIFARDAVGEEIIIGNNKNRDLEGKFLYLRSNSEDVLDAILNLAHRRARIASPSTNIQPTNSPKPLEGKSGSIAA